MLTRDQKILLEPLTQHPKYGMLLIKAMKTWETNKPGIESFGANRYDGIKWFDKWELSDENCYCLIGAAIIGENASASYTETAAKIISSTSEVIWQIVYGFDDDKNIAESEAYLFGRAVGEIVLKDNK